MRWQPDRRPTRHGADRTPLPARRARAPSGPSAAIPNAIRHNQNRGEFASNFTKTSGPRLKIFDGHPQLDRSLGAFTKSCLVPRYRSVG
jgi:hypothetical protein